MQVRWAVLTCATSEGRCRTHSDIVRYKLNAGVLPRDDALKVWPRTGSGKACTACEKPVLPSQTEYEIEYYDGRPAIPLHVRCHAVLGSRAETTSRESG